MRDVMPGSLLCSSFEEGEFGRGEAFVYNGD